MGRERKSAGGKASRRGADAACPIAAEPKAKAKTAKTLIDKLEVEADDEPKQKRSKTRSLEETIAKCLRGNFRNLGPTETGCTIVEGKTLRQTLMELKQKKEQGERVPWGKYLFNTLRDKYGSALDTTRRLFVRDPGQPQDPKLQKALIFLLQHKREQAPMLMWLRTGDLCNQKNLCGLCRAFARMTPLTNMDHATITLELMQYVQRVGAHKAFEDEFKLMKHSFDAALQKSHSFLKANEQGARGWWETVNGFAGILLPAEDSRLSACAVLSFAVCKSVAYNTGPGHVGL